QKNAGIEVTWNTANGVNMGSYEVEESTDGTNFTKATTVAAKNAASNSYNWFDGTVINGDNYYRIKSVEKNGSSRYSNIVKVRIGGKNAEFTIYPNPVKGGIINLQMGNVEKGIYTVKLFSNLGQELVSRTIIHNGGSASQTILLGNAVPQGSYRMQVMNNGTTVATKTVIVE
ncbi:MAG: T9SS type A sorting domain-containing protein, partial [Chitinophagaceae bacterium]|nr:T9SS type A sorting domain-containing protein [Chitinophagaceae bacterium]